MLDEAKSLRGLSTVTHDGRWLAVHWALGAAAIILAARGSPLGVFFLFFYMSWGPLVAPNAFFYWYTPLVVMALALAIRTVVREQRTSFVGAHVATALIWMSAVCAALWGEYVGP
jgi:hypothetical protein